MILSSHIKLLSKYGNHVRKRKVIFIGGIHGVGKTTLCNKLVKELDITHYSASELLNRAKTGLYAPNKAVVNISGNQDILLSALNEFAVEPSYLLDGHFALFGPKYEIQLVPEETFTSISPVAICVLTCEIKVVLDRIANRDGIQHDMSSYQALSNSEQSHAKMIAEQLDVPIYFHDTEDNIQELIYFIRSHLE